MDAHRRWHLRPAHGQVDDSEFGIRYGQGFALGQPAFFARSALRLQEEATAV